MEVKNLAEFTSNETPLYLDDCRVKPFDVPHRNLGTSETS